MKSKGGKTHLYPNKRTETTQKGYCKTACGRDGYLVGGLISCFFKRTLPKDQCKICNKTYKAELK